MNIFDFTIIAASEAPQAPTLFPFPLSFHMVFTLIAVVFFIISFAKYKKPYQLIFAIAVPLSLLIHVADNIGSRPLYYAVGIAEAVLIIAAFITSLIFKSDDEDSTKAEE